MNLYIYNKYGMKAVSENRKSLTKAIEFEIAKCNNQMDLEQECEDIETVVHENGLLTELLKSGYEYYI